MPHVLASVVIGATLATAAPSLAGEPIAVMPKGKSIFEAYDPDAKAGTNVSGATCFDDGSCILIADEMIAMQSIKLNLGGTSPSYRAGRTYGLMFGDRCTDITQTKNCKEVDLEAIARKGRDIFVSGSMGNRSRSGKRANDRWFLARFSLGKSGKPLTGSLTVQSKRSLLKQMFVGHAVIAPLLELPLQCGGVNIEGLTVIGDQLFFGLRSPADLINGRAYIIQSSETVLAAKRKSDVEPTKLHSLTFRNASGKPIRNTGIRALETLGDRLLIATADAGVSAPSSASRLKDIKERCAAVPGGARLPNVAGKRPLVPRIWIWDPASQADPIEIVRLGGPYADEKLEGLAVLGNPSSKNKKVDLLLTIDGQNDVPALALLKGLKLQY
ncbi:MAG: DUF3616 domain-containing protein [Hyphomicrobiales bacterium]|nr:DUF3616 domain-containing protein [Hyphomicrobiales bacterium]